MDSPPGGATPPAAETVSATLPAAPAPELTAPQSTPTNENPGGFTEEDFADPTIGPKLKHWQKGWEGATKREKEAMAQLEKHRNVVQNLEALATRYPSLGKQIRDAWDGNFQEPTAVVPTDETDEQRSQRTAREELKREIKADMAMNNMWLQLGKGDVEAGRALYQEKAPHLNAVMATMGSGTFQDRLNLAWEILSRRSAATTVPASPPPPTPTGAVRTESGAGATQATQEVDWSTLTKDQQFHAAMKAAGFSSVSQYMDEAGAFGR